MSREFPVPKWRKPLDVFENAMYRNPMELDKYITAKSGRVFQHLYFILIYKEKLIMAKQVLIQFRADKALKEEVADIYSQLGMDLPTAFRMFMNKSKQVRGLPFEAVLPPVSNREDFRNAFNALREEAAEVPDMSLDEINAEISAARADRKKGGL